MRIAIAAAWILFSVLIVATIHLHRVASRAVDASREAHLHGDFMLGVLYAEEAAECAPIPPAGAGTDLLIDYAQEAEKNHDSAGATLAWQAYERALASTGRITEAERTRVHEGLARAGQPAPGEEQRSVAPPHLPEAPDTRGPYFSGLVAIGVIAAGAFFVRRPTRVSAALTLLFGLVFAGLGFLV